MASRTPRRRDTGSRIPGLARTLIAIRWPIALLLALAVASVLGVVVAAQLTDDTSDTQHSSADTSEVIPLARPTTHAATSPTTPTATNTDEDDGFAYIPWGPSDAVIPEQYRALAAATGDPERCTTVQDKAPQDKTPEDTFWPVVVEMCLAISGHGSWPSTVPAPTPADNDYQACLDQDIVAMLKRALRWHQQHPGAVPRVTQAHPSSRSDCQKRLYNTEIRRPVIGDPPGIAVVFDAPGLDGETQTQVTLRAKQLSTTAEATIDEDSEDPGQGLKRFVVQVPVAAYPRTVRLEVASAFGTLTTTIELPAVDTTPTPTPTPPKTITTVTPSTRGSVAPTSAPS